LVAAVLSTGATELLAAEPSYEELLRENQLLKAQVEEQRARAVAAGQPGFTKAEADATVERVIGDADTRSQLLAGNGVTAGWDNGFFIKSDDGNFTLKPGVQAQFRHATAHTDGLKNDGGDSTVSGFEFRRLRFRFDGNVFTPDFTYSFVWDVNRSGGGVTLLDGWFKYKFADAWSIKGGQFKDPVHHERLLSGFTQLAVERTLVESLIGGNLTDRVQGVSLIYGDYARDNPLYAEVAFHDGANSKNTDFRDSQPGASGQPATFQADFGAAGRVEYKLFGDWKDYRDYTAKGVKRDLLVVGAGVDFTQRDGSDQFLPTADVQWKSPFGLAAYAAAYARQIEFRNATGEDSRFDWGAQAQISYLFTPAWEVFGRYDVTHFDGDFQAGENTFHEFTAGFNYYFGRDGRWVHRAKFTLDVNYLPNGAPSDQTGVDVLASTGDEFLIRAQFTLQL
jgi:hypothetical protein